MFSQLSHVVNESDKTLPYKSIFDYILYFLFLQILPEKTQMDDIVDTSNLCSGLVNAKETIIKNEISQVLSEENTLSFNNECTDSNLIPDQDVNSLTKFEILTKDQIKKEFTDDDPEVSSFSVFETGTENENTLKCEDVST